LNLIFQFVITATLVLALFAIVKKKYMIHGIIMVCSIVLHTISALVIMVPSLLSLDGALSDLSTHLSLLVVTHTVVGSIVEMLGVFLVAAWISNRTKVDNCFRRKHVMEATIVLWVLEFVLGVYVYMTLYPLV
jgi:uncharacterized membrane protein YozB (DUF420 family)